MLTEMDTVQTIQWRHALQELDGLLKVGIVTILMLQNIQERHARTIIHVMEALTRTATVIQPNTLKRGTQTKMEMDLVQTYQLSHVYNQLEQFLNLAIVTIMMQTNTQMQLALTLQDAQDTLTRPAAAQVMLQPPKHSMQMLILTDSETPMTHS
jgi:hypothetical protein